ncbi:MAG: ABC transporter substrate-binding protein [Eubacteriales bacterium]|nr:ABC transporter substrate-binding protein [Clostridiales bacterium]MDY5835995.1 ABC transporter substrate-binding protein [Eubacteriales bacterium]
MKKFLTTILVLVLLLVPVVSCKQEVPGSKTEATTVAEKAEDKTEAATEKATEATTEKAEEKPAAEETEEKKAEADSKNKDLEGTTLKVLLAYGGADASFPDFTAKTGIKVEFTSISTGKALAQIQAADGVSDADVWFGGGVDSYLAATDLGYLMQYDSEGRKAVADQYKDAEGYWTSLALVPAGFLVNTEVLEEKSLESPKTWEDLTDPKYEGELIMASPGISGTQYAILNGTLQALGEEKGWDLWKKIDANVTQYAQGGGEPGPKTCAGEFGIGILAITGGTYALESQYPVKVVVPEDYIPWTPAPIAIFKDAKNVEAAKLFVDYYLSKEGQESLREADARIMSREDVDVPKIMDTIDLSKLIKQDVTLFGAQRDDLLAQWDELVK